MSHEVRWFFPGRLDRFPELARWIASATPFPQEGRVPPPKPEGRLGDAPDVYLVVPGANDMGVKWREGQLQIKGRTASLGLQRFGREFYGAVEVWAKWSYTGEGVNRALAGWFDPAAGRAWDVTAVRKTRTLRKTRLDAAGRFVEVDPHAYVDRGLNVELTDLEIDGQRYASLGFEAFPDDSAMPEAFTRATEAWLAGLEDSGVVLAEHQTMGYPAFLRHRALREVPAT